MTNSQPKNNKPNRILAQLSKLFLMPIIALGFFAVFGILWVKRNFQGVTFDMMMMQLRMPLRGTGNGLLLGFLLQVVLPSVALAIGFWLLGRAIRKKGKVFSLGGIVIFPNRAVSFGLAVIFLLAAFGGSFRTLGVPQYLANRHSQSDFIERNYIAPSSENLMFPEEKRNLIYIYMESLESTFLSADQGGQMEQCVMPELFEIAQSSVSFSDGNLLGGAVPVPGAGVTSAAMVAQTAGLPLYISSDWQGETAREIFIDQAVAMGDILAQQGYAQYLMVGSDASFGARDQYYKAHGGAEILDLATARAAGIVPEGYDNGFWGMEDMYLYQFARQELTRIGATDAPFCFTMLTVDTHFPNGYDCALCEHEFNDTYLNAFSCASRQVSSFLDWLKQQDFYENTTVVIVGDHLAMSVDLFSRNNLDVNQRRVYNAFINTPDIAPLESKDRLFSTMDFFPTTLAAMGVEIVGDRLGLGTSLFSDKPTLLEMYGYEMVNDELLKTSDYYNNTFLSSPNSK